jgi:hypothetical protein
MLSERDFDIHHISQTTTLVKTLVTKVQVTTDISDAVYQISRCIRAELPPCMVAAGPYDRPIYQISPYQKIWPAVGSDVSRLTPVKQFLQTAPEQEAAAQPPAADAKHLVGNLPDANTPTGRTAFAILATARQFE